MNQLTKLISTGPPLLFVRPREPQLLAWSLAISVPGLLAFCPAVPSAEQGTASFTGKGEAIGGSAVTRGLDARVGRSRVLCRPTGATDVVATNPVTTVAQDYRGRHTTQATQVTRSLDMNTLVLN